MTHCKPAIRDDIWDTVRRLAGPFLVALILAAGTLPLSAQAKTFHGKKAHLTPVQTKYASMVVDADTGEVLHSVNADALRYPASLTKIMTLYLLFDELDSGRIHLTDRMPISAHAASQAPSKLDLQPGQTLSVENALFGLVTKSANDAAVTVAEFLGGSEPAFAERMTRKAHELGMRQTQFRNASGLPIADQYSSARDMATLAHALIHNHAKDYHYFSTRQFTYNGNVINNHNHMMEWYDGADGIKTGYIGASGFNLVASAKRNGRRLIGVVFGGDSAPARDRHMARLLDDAFAHAPSPDYIEVADLQGSDKTSPPDDQAPNNKQKAAPSAQAVLQAMAATKLTHPAGGRLLHPAKHEVATGDTNDKDDEDEDDDDDWGVQVGAYHQEVLARQAAALALAKLGDGAADGEVTVTRGKGRHASWRARITGLTEDIARKACRTLAKAHLHHPCAVVTPDSEVASR